MKLINKVEEKLLGRVCFEYEFEKMATSPSRVEIQKEVAKLQKAKFELVVIEKIDVQFGTNKFKIKAVVYNSKEDYKKSVPAHLAKKSVIADEKAKEE